MHGQWSNLPVKTPLRLGQQRIANMQVSAAEQRVATDMLRCARVGLTTTVRLPRRTPMNDGSGPIRTPIRILAAVFGVVFPVGGVLLFPTGIAGSLASGWRSFKES